MQPSRHLLIILMTALTWAGPARGGLDFDRPRINIPETHASKAYRWQAEKAPADFNAEIIASGNPGDYILRLNLPKMEKTAREVHLFITDPDLESFAYLAPEATPAGEYPFHLNAVRSDRRIIEVSILTGRGWIRERQTLKNTPITTKKTYIPRLAPGYRAGVELFPEKLYSRHVGTMVFTIYRNGRAITDLDLIAGRPMIVASWRRGGWFSSPGDFIFAADNIQKIDTETAVSLVPEESGSHRVFVLFSHQGRKQIFTFDFYARLEQTHNNNLPWNLAPAE